MRFVCPFKKPKFNIWVCGIKCEIPRAREDFFFELFLQCFVDFCRLVFCIRHKSDFDLVLFEGSKLRLSMVFGIK